MLANPRIYIKLDMYHYILLIAFIHNVNGEDPVVQIPQGKLLGRSRLNRDGGTFYSFQNIPYGKPPIGDLRFKTAQPADGWQDIRDATKDLPQCIQIHTDEGQEDCLYLNVYVPELPVRNVSLKPVMVFIYGGAYDEGTAKDSILYGPEFILTKDVILVSMNYRLGIYGFLTLDDPNLEITGNAGLKDQVLALKWIKDNILHFGGNPDNVLIFGDSAGAQCVHLHILSPMSKGLFHKAIFQSGNVLTDLSSLKIRNNAVILAETLGIQTENWEEMLKSLQALPATPLTAAERLLTDIYKPFSAPVIEVASSESFLSGRPLDTIKLGNYNQVPFITGFTNAEGLIFEINEKKLTNQSILITNFSEWIPRDLQIQSGSEDEAILSEKLKKFYYGNSEPSRDDISGAVHLITDSAFAFPAYRSMLEHLKTALCPIYFYFFTADTKLNLYKLNDSTAALFPGASHADDIFYLFKTMWTPSNIALGSTEDRAIRNLVNLWTNFANNGNPTPNWSEYTWKPVTRNKFNYLHIDSKKSMPKLNLKRKSFQFWSKIYEEYFPR